MTYSRGRGQETKRALLLSGLILRKIFNHNQDKFTEAEPDTIPTIAVIEEAQSVLGERGGANAEPFVEWVKEGRKYYLGSVMITQQPSSIATEILSQGDNWFVFHLLSSADLQALKRANSHFSDDLLSSLLNEPIPGHCVFWSSSGGKPYPVPVRVFSFEDQYTVLDPDGSRGPVRTYAMELREHFARLVAAVAAPVGTPPGGAAGSELEPESEPEPDPDEGGVDVYTAWLERAFAKLAADEEFMRDLRERGCPWGAIKGRLEELLPVEWPDRGKIAFQNVRAFLDRSLGKNAWDTERRPNRSGKAVTWVVLRRG